MAQNTGTVTISVVRNPMQAFADAGWKFTYDEQTRVVQMIDSAGGRFALCGIGQIHRSGDEPLTFHEVGHAIAAWMNEKSPLPEIPLDRDPDDYPVF